LNLYVDTSVLVSALTNEVEAGKMQTWLEDQGNHILHISEWVRTEFSAALSIKLRLRDIEIAERAEALLAFKRLINRSFLTIPISTSHFRTAANFADDYPLGLRAADSLHLAIASEANLSLCTRDRKLAAAGAKLGVSTRLL
jgi:predicted nucleic acid-binding protein